jgi:hypothetical protein
MVQSGAGLVPQAERQAFLSPMTPSFCFLLFLKVGYMGFSPSANTSRDMFFKNVVLHKSMSYRKREDEEFVRDSREKYRKELMKKQEERAKKLARANSIYYRLLRYIFQ